MVVDLSDGKESLIGIVESLRDKSVASDNFLLGSVAGLL